MQSNSRYVDRQVAYIAPYLSGAKRVLDFGCGDMTLVRGLRAQYPKISFTGVDVVDAGVRMPGVSFVRYDGTKLPFQRDTFDTVIAYHVFHHCDVPRENLKEVLRVAKTCVIFVEPVVRYSWEVPFMKIVDRLGNGWRDAAIPMPFTFQTRDTWVRWVDELGWRVENMTTVSVLPVWLPIGESVLFSCVRKK